MIEKNKTMKTKIISVVFILIFMMNTNLFAQEGIKTNDYKDAITFGLLHTFNLTYISGTYPSQPFGNLESKTSVSAPRFTFDVGMTVDYYLSNKLSVQFDFVYTYMGAHLITKSYLYNEVGKIENKKYFTYGMDYFKFPLTLNYYPMEKLYVNGGGYFSTKISSHNYENWYDKRNPIDDASPIDYGIVAGFGFNTAYAKIGFQYSYGINDFITNNDYNLHHSVFQFIVRWKFYSDVRKINL